MAAGEIRIVLVGLGSYGEFYLHALLNPPPEKRVRLAAVADPRIGGHRRLDELRQAGVAVFEDLDVCLERQEAELYVLASPIACHAPQTRAVLARGLPVLCEKPVAATIQEGLDMRRAEAASRAFVAVGYQWSFGGSVQRLKRDIMAGDFGRPLRMRVLFLSPRGHAYYRRNNWAGRVKDGDGNWVLDSPFANATAHFLHNCLYLLGPAREASEWPARVTAELYRANAIENCDAAAIRIVTKGGVEILHVCAHSVPHEIGPMMHYEFEGADVVYSGKWDGPEPFVARLRNGERRVYPSPFEGRFEKLWQTVDAARGGPRVACGIEAALPHLVCANAAQDSMPEVAQMPAELVVHGRDEKGPLTYAKNQDTHLACCFATGLLPSEHGGIPWARPGTEIDTTSYAAYPSRGGERNGAP